jgi:hypothetical protein
MVTGRTVNAENAEEAEDAERLECWSTGFLVLLSTNCGDYGRFGVTMTAVR